MVNFVQNYQKCTSYSKSDISIQTLIFKILKLLFSKLLVSIQSTQAWFFKLYSFRCIQSRNENWFLASSLTKKKKEKEKEKDLALFKTLHRILIYLLQDDSTSWPSMIFQFWSFRDIQSQNEKRSLAWKREMD